MLRTDDPDSELGMKKPEHRNVSPCLPLGREDDCRSPAILHDAVSDPCFRTFEMRGLYFAAPQSPFGSQPEAAANRGLLVILVEEFRVLAEW